MRCAEPVVPSHALCHARLPGFFKGLGVVRQPEIVIGVGRGLTRHPRQRPAWLAQHQPAGGVGIPPRGNAGIGQAAPVVQTFAKLS